MGLTTESGKVLSVQDAQKDISEFQKTVNERIIPAEPDWMKEMRKKRVHIINVGPWTHEQWAGSYGKFTIYPALKSHDLVREAHGVLYGECLEFDKKSNRWISPICSQQFELLIDNEAAMRYDAGQNGENFAWELLGEGRGQNASFSLRHRGCIVIKGETPTEDELLMAKLELEDECRRLVAEARELWASNEPMAKQGIVKGRHDVAAEILNLTDEDWLV